MTKYRVGKAMLCAALVTVVFLLSASFVFADSGNSVLHQGRHFTLGDVDGDGLIEDAKKSDRVIDRVIDGADDFADGVRDGIDDAVNEIEDGLTKKTDAEGSFGTGASDMPKVTDTPSKETATVTSEQSRPHVTSGGTVTTSEKRDDATLNPKEDGFNWVGLIIGVLVVAAIVIVVVLLIPKNVGQGDRKNQSGKNS